MSQNGHTTVHSRGPNAGGTIGLGHSVSNPPVNNMNLSSTPSSVSWSHVNVNGASVSVSSGIQKVMAATGQQQQDAKAAPSPPNSNQSGTTLKEHDLLGLSEVSSSTSRGGPVQGSLQDEGHEFEELNLKMELGPPAARKKSDTGFSHPKVPAAVDQQQVPTASDSGNSHGGSDGGQVAEQGIVVGDKSPSSAEQNGTASDHADRGLSYGAPPQGGRADSGVANTGCRPLIDSEALMKWHSEQGVDRNSLTESLRLGISLQAQRVGTQDGLNEKKAFLNSVDRNNREVPQELKQQEDPSWQQERMFQEDVSKVEKTQERPIVVQEQQQQASKHHQQQQQLQLERQKQYEAYQMSDKRPVMERKCLPALQPPGPEQRFPSVHDRSPRHPEPPSRPWQNQMKFRLDGMVTSTAPIQQLSSQQDIEVSRPGYPVCASNFAVNRNMYAGAPKLGVTGSKRNFDAITGSDARSVNEARSVLSGPLPVPGASANTANGASSEAEAKALCQQQMKVQPGMQVYPWAQKSTLAAPTWQIGIEQSGGSFGPFPSSQRPTQGAQMNKNGFEVGAGAGVDAKAWDGQPKGHHEIISASTQKLASAPADNKQSTSEATTALAAETSAAAAPRAAAPTAPAAPAAVGWPPLRSFRKNLAVTPRPVPSETPPPRQPPAPTPTPTPVSTPSAQSNSWFVKVNMDGYPVGRKVDLKFNSSYEKLSQALDEMFRPQFETFLNGQNGQNRLSLPSDLKRNFLQGPDFVLTYEDQDGDLMLVGDVPWTMFIDTVKRLRIMKGSEAIGLGNRAAEKSVKTAQPNV